MSCTCLRRFGDATEACSGSKYHGVRSFLCYFDRLLSTSLQRQVLFADEAERRHDDDGRRAGVTK